MAVNGHSFGGYETNYIIAHTSIFAAALSAASPSNFISGYGALLLESGICGQFLYETGQMRVGSTLWERPDLYINNSRAVFNANNVITPLLMMHNKKGWSSKLFVGG